MFLMGSFMSKIFQWLGLSPTEEDKKISAMIKNGYPSKVVGRGTIMIDESAVLDDENFQKMRGLAKKIVDRQTEKAA